MNFDFNADLDPAFHPNADPDPAAVREHVPGTYSLSIHFRVG